FLFQVKSDYVSLNHPGVQRLFFAVQLDFIFPEGLVDPADPQMGKLGQQILVQPLRNQIKYLQFSHGAASNTTSFKIRASLISRVTQSQSLLTSSTLTMG